MNRLENAPRLARALMWLVLPPSEREFFIGDLDEEFSQRARTSGRRQARRWYWKQVLCAPGWWRVTSPDFTSVHTQAGKGEVMLSIVQDVRYAFRSLMKSPSLLLFALAALALGIGANTAVFSVVNGILLKPLPYAVPDRLVRLFDSNPPTLPTFSVAYGNFLAWERRSKVFAGLGAYREEPFSLSGQTGDGAPEHVIGARITAGLLPVLGVSPIAGRWFTVDEDRPGANRVVLIGHSLWMRRFGGETGIIGKDVRIEGAPYTVVGIMPKDFRVPLEGAELWIPYGLDPATADRSSHFLRVIGKLNSPAALKQAQTEINQIAERLDEEDPLTRKGWRVAIVPLAKSITGDVDNTLWLMLGTVALVLLIASANVGNLLLARSVSRRKEIALRLSLGASRARLLRQLLVESVVLSVAGGTLGIGLASIGLNVLKAQGPAAIPRLADVAIDLRVLAFTAVITIATGLLFGAGPALRGSGLDLSESLKIASHGTTTGRRSRRTSRLLVVAQITIAMVVVISCGLMLRTLWNLYAIDPGFRTEGRLTFSINLNSDRYSQSQTRAAFIASVLEQLRTLPGVRSAAATHRLPLLGNSALSVFIDGKPQANPSESVVVSYRSITPEYFDVMGIPMLRGRTFTWHETQESGHVAVINQRMAAQYWPGEDPLGKGIRNGDRLLTIVGIVADSKENTLDGDGRISIYQPYSEVPVTTMNVVVHIQTDAKYIGAAILREIRRLDPDIAISALRPLDDVVNASIGVRSFTAALLSIFAGIALLLATSGIYGLLAYAVNQRIREIGVRMALGASRWMVLRHIIGDGLRLIVPGIVAGTLGSLLVTRRLSTLLFGVTATDPVTFAAIAGFLILVGILACYIPARKAASVDPLLALRAD